MQKFLVILVLLLLFGTNVYAKDLKAQGPIELDEPWGSSFINNNEIIITEKSGKIKIINIQNGNVTKIDHNLKFVNIGQGGLLDIIYKNNYIWISYTENRGNSETSTY